MARNLAAKGHLDLYMRDKITINQLCSCVIWKANDETWKIPIFFIDNESKQAKNFCSMWTMIQLLLTNMTVINQMDDEGETSLFIYHQ